MTSRRRAHVGLGGTSSKRSTSQAWLDSLDAATTCLRAQDRGDFEQAEHSLYCLNELEQVLLRKEAKWDRPPKELPPTFGISNSILQGPTVEEHKLDAYQISRDSVLSNNPFAVIQGDDDDDSSYSELEEDELEAGDEIFLNKAGNSKDTMAMRRLMIRIVTCQAEVFAHLSYLCRSARPMPLWKDGSDRCRVAVDKIHQALILADSEISRWFNEDKKDLSELIADADIVEVAVQHYTEEAERFRHEAVKQMNRIKNRLRPQWSSRDQVKNRMGSDRWHSNPAPKNDYARLRAQDEEQLREIEQALSQLEDLDVEALVSSAKGLRSRLFRKDHGGEQQIARYNGLRPSDISRRVPLELYPDPTEFGWIFTGSSGNTVEFFEKDQEDGNTVKLDWYFTTGTVKTSMFHPNQGKTQLFAASESVTPDLYRQILMHPRTHTGVRYQTRKHRNRNKNRRRSSKKNTAPGFT